MNPTWLATATSVQDSWDALEAASGDAPYILDSDEVGVGFRWVIATVPIADIDRAPCIETDQECAQRKSDIRSVPEGELFRPILELRQNGIVVLLDGGHRLEVALERGKLAIEALVKIL